MENPKSVSRFLMLVFTAGSVVAVAVSIYWRDYYIVLGWLAILAVFVIACVVLGFVNLAIFGPVLWLMSRLERRKANDPIRHNEANNDQPQSPPSQDHLR
jgi:hypothetical protein